MANCPRGPQGIQTGNGPGGKEIANPVKNYIYILSKCLLRMNKTRPGTPPLPLPPLPSFLFPPPFFWRGPTGFTRQHQKITHVGNVAVDPGEKRGSHLASPLASPLIPEFHLFLRRLQFDLASSSHKPRSLVASPFNPWGFGRALGIT